jgi:hypothetical protein
MNKEDIEYILWIAKRLVYRYQEEQDIIDKTERIIKDWQKTFTEFKNKEESIEKYTSDIISNLVKIGSFNKEFRKNIEEEKNQVSSKVMSSGVAFENLDFDDIFNLGQ